MQTAGDKSEVDLSRLGPMLVIASSLIFAIRSARWPRIDCDAPSSPEWDSEIEESVKIAHRILFHLLSKSPFLFTQKDICLTRGDAGLREQNVTGFVPQPK